MNPVTGLESVLNEASFMNGTACIAVYPCEKDQETGEHKVLQPPDGFQMIPVPIEPGETNHAFCVRLGSLLNGPLFSGGATLLSAALIYRRTVALAEEPAAAPVEQ
ncbi:uncharacterized protein LOC111065301 [Drosophila obscura]|uniref:uncharacterized protein LOC111065301 n=1 Tax=Drosophila obscura TaxID=7282 RepID=UPI001BB24A8E|nr:uncharacterized protein LOC111065301 [Drosophila obscura]